MRIKIRFRQGRWNLYVVYKEGTPSEYEVPLTDAAELTEAHTAAMELCGQ